VNVTKGRGDPPLVFSPLFPALGIWTKVAPRSGFASILPQRAIRVMKRGVVTASPPPALQRAAFFLVMYYSAAVNPSGDAALQISPPLPSMRSSSRQHLPRREQLGETPTGGAGSDHQTD